MFPYLDDGISPDVSKNDNITYMTLISLYHGEKLNVEKIASLETTILNLIDSPTTRHDGLLLFETALKQRIPFYIKKWPSFILASLKGIDVACKEISFRILNLLLRSDSKGNYRSTLRFTMIAFMQELISEEYMNCVSAVHCLSLCMKIAPDKVLDIRPQIEEFLMKHLDTASSEMCEAVSDCLIAFLYVKETNQSSFSEKYSSLQKKVLYTLQEILKRLSNFKENNEGNIDVKETFKLPDAAKVELSTSMTLARIFSTLSVCASKLLSSKLIELEEVSVPVLWILELVYSVFEMKQIAENNKLVYPIIHKSALIILEPLIQHFDLIEQIENIIHVIRKSVEASYRSIFENKCNSQMRYATWKLLNMWLFRNGLSVSLNVGNKKYLILELLSDITLEMSNDQKNAPKKLPNKKQASEEIFFPDPAENSTYCRSKIRTCNEALKALRIIIYTASPFLEEKFKENITSAVISTSKNIQKHNRFKMYPFPYMDEECRCNLYELNLALLISSNSYKVPVLTQTVAILKIALRDPSLKIKELSHRATSMSRFMLHSRKKVPDAFTHKKTIFEPATEDNLCHGWENPTWIVNNSENTNISATNLSHKSNSQVNLPHETNENERPNTFPSTEYSSSEFDSTSYSKEEIQCNGDGISEVLPSSQSESEIEDQCEQEMTSKQVNIPHPSKSVDKEITSDPDISSEEYNLSIAEVVVADQNGVCTEEEILNSSKGENTGYSCSEDGSYEEEEETKDYGDSKHESGVSDGEPPLKKQKTLEGNEIQEELDDSRTEEVKDTTSETEVARERSGEDGEPMPGSPTVEDICKTFVLCEPTTEVVES